MSPEKQAGKNKIMTCQQSKTDNKIRSNKPQQSRCQSALGMVFAFLSAICGATSGLLVKFVKGADADQIQFIRVCIQYICLLPLLTYRKESIVKDNRLTNCFLLSRAAFGMISHVTLIYSIGFLPLGDAMSIQYSYVTLVGLFAFFFLKEPCGFADVLATLVALAGLIFITQPSFMFGASKDDVDPTERILGVALACFSAVTTALAYILVRKMGSDIHYSLSLFYYAWEGALFLPIYMAFRGTLEIPCFNDVLIMLGSGISGFLAQILMTIALQKERAGPATLVQTSQIIFAFIFQALFLPSKISLYSGIGAGLVFASAFFLLLRNMRRKAESDSDDN